MSKLRCVGECKIQLNSSVSTLAYYPPTYNKEGVNVNPDKNTVTESYKCQSCGIEFLKENGRLRRK